MEELNNEIAVTNTNEEFVLKAKPVKVKVSELTDQEQDIYNWLKVVPMDRVCAMYGVHKETIEAIINKVK
jgi:hypothetical protein